MKKTLGLFGAALLLVAACGTQQEEAKVVTPETEEEKQLYAIGLSVAGNTLSPFKGEFSADEVDLIVAGFADALLDAEAKVDIEEYGEKLNTYLQQRFANVQKRMTEQAVVEKEKGTTYLDKAAAEAGAVKTESGIVYIETQAGTGAVPEMTDKVKVHYTGKLIDGTVFDSSVERGEPIVHPLNGFVPGWSEGVSMMKVGGKARLVIPPELAYGDQSPPGSSIPPGSTLIFEVELLGIEE
ncbi:MAG: FKBP-type peptidyl-prolyl cis-trans isomerase FkpA [Candidatus Latescibacterota bacterium]|jgi:FKBP-type peptidyl-prolyl cis-trans isomerase FkpA